MKATRRRGREIALPSLGRPGLNPAKVTNSLPVGKRKPARRGGKRIRTMPPAGREALGVRPWPSARTPGAAGNEQRLIRDVRMSSPNQSLLFALSGAKSIEWVEAIAKSRVSRCPAPAAPGDAALYTYSHRANSVACRRSRQPNTMSINRCMPRPMLSAPGSPSFFLAR